MTCWSLFNCCVDACCPAEGIVPPKISVTGWTPVAGGWNGTVGGCCFSKEFTQGGAGVWNTYCSAWTQNLSYEAIHDTDEHWVKAPRGTFTAGTVSCPITEEECCIPDPPTEILKNCYSRWYAEYRSRMEIRYKTGNLVIFYGKGEFICDGTPVCKWYLMSVYEVEVEPYQMIYRNYVYTVDFTCSDCIDCPPDTSFSDNDCDTCGDGDCPPWVSASLLDGFDGGSRKYYFCRLNLYDDEPTLTSHTIDGTPNCTGAGGCVPSCGIYGYLDEICFTSKCIQIIPEEIETCTWTVTVLNFSCSGKCGYVCGPGGTCEDGVACVRCEYDCADRTQTFNCDRTWAGEAPTYPTCITLLLLGSNGCVSCSNISGLACPEDFTTPFYLTGQPSETKRCGMAGVPPGVPYMCYSSTCCWATDCGDPNFCQVCNPKYWGILGYDSTATINVDQGTDSPQSVCFPINLITVTLSGHHIMPAATATFNVTFLAANLTKP
jgi:hypothetical protein